MIPTIIPNTIAIPIEIKVDAIWIPACPLKSLPSTGFG